VNVNGNITGHSIIRNIDPDRYLHMSPPFVQAMLEYVWALEEVARKASTDIKVEDCQGWDDQWCPTSCRSWRTCKALVNLKEIGRRGERDEF